MRRDHVLQFVLEAAQTPDFQGVTAQAVADALSIWRNDAAVELNKLVAEGKLRRVGKKNVRFFPASEETADIRPEPAVQEEPPQAEEETGQYRAFSGLVGADGSLKYQLRVAMAAVAYPPNGLNMLITGSTGSGKSHFARTIWEYAKETKALCGAHAPIPFVEFNCAEYADNPQLLLSHLFGYKKGAFTGALEDKPGLVEQANGGILFLDEIHGLSSTGQEMFFSLLDTGVFRRVGDNTPRTSRFMLIGATTKPLTDLLETFLRRMPVLISMPTLSDRPMKERLELVEHFYAEEAAHIGRTLRIQKGALNSILDYSLHSNLGVLKNLVQLSCAKAFLRENVAGNRTGEIAVTFSDLSFQTYNVSAETEKYAHGDLHFAEDLVVPNQRIQSSATLPRSSMSMTLWNRACPASRSSTMMPEICSRSLLRRSIIIMWTWSGPCRPRMSTAACSTACCSPAASASAASFSAGPLMRSTMSIRPLRRRCLPCISASMSAACARSSRPSR